MTLRHLAAILAGIVALPAAAQTISGNTIRPGTTPQSAMVTQPANTIVGNCTGSTASPAACTAAAAKLSLSLGVVDVSGAEATANKDVASGYAGLTSGTLLKLSEFPAIGGGDVSCAAGAASCTIASGAVTLGKMANESANTLLGNNTGSSATPIALTQAQATALLNPVTSSLQGLAPASGGGTTNFLRADASWTQPSFSGLSGSASCAQQPALTGDVTSSAGSCATTAAGSLVKSISLTTPSITYTSPVTFSVSSGAATGTLSLINQSANTVFAGPTTGGAATPTWRALVSADIPSNAANTTGSAAKWTTARNLAGNSVDGSANVAFGNAFVAEGTSDSGLSGAQFLGSLGTGLLKNTTTTGVLSIAIANTDYLPAASPSATGVLTVPAATLSGAVSKGNIGTTGALLVGAGAAITDTSSSGSVSDGAASALAGSTISANSSTTFSRFATLYLGAPTASTNVTITTPLSLRTAGAGFFGGFLTANVGLSSVGATTISGGTLNLNSSSNFATNINTGTSNALATIGGGSNGVVINSNSAGSITDTGFISGGTKFTTSGCSVSSTTGGATAGVFTLGANNCSVVITMNGATGLTAPNGWTCQAHDRTSITIIIDGESSSTTTTATIAIPITAGTTDVISFSCTGY